MLKSTQVEVLKVSRQKMFCVVPYRLATARAFVTMHQLLSLCLTIKCGRIVTPEAELSVVVSPPVSLVVDQVSSLHSRGISDAILSVNSGNTPMKQLRLANCHRCWSEVAIVSALFVCILFSHKKKG